MLSEVVESLGSPSNPYLVAPADWKENGLPYAAYCQCSRCGYLSQSSFTFDFYADLPGDPLVCEGCELYAKEHKE